MMNASSSGGGGGGGGSGGGGNKRMKLWQLEQQLQRVQPFQTPKIQLEQYMTTAHLASHLCYVAHHTFDDLEDKCVLDLGCGTGMLAIGCAIMGAKRVVGIDIDPDALEIAAQNCKDILCDDDSEETPVELICMNVERLHRRLSRERRKGNTGTSVGGDGMGGEDKSASMAAAPRLHRMFDTVVLNPPFGTRSKGMDMKFLKIAARMASRAVYSLHKSSTREYILKKATSWGYEPEVVAELRYDLKQSYSFHKRQSKDIAVDVIRLKIPQGISK